MARRLDQRAAGFEAAFTDLVDGNRGAKEAVDEVVARILADVKKRGDAAIIEHTARLDNVTLEPATLSVSGDEIEAAVAATPAPLREALAVAATRIEDYHRRQMPEDVHYRDDKGVLLGARWRPVSAAALYVPGGRAAYPSSVLMNALPAKVAGVPRIVMTVPAPGGVIAPAVLAAARLAGVGEVYRIGGAQAVGALAFGSESIRPVDKIVGPGNVYVAAAKRQVYGIVGIDMIAGPSEILVVADGDNDPQWIAMDLLSQAEHDPDAQSILITDDANFADKVEKAVSDCLETLQRREIASASWRDHGAIIVVEDLSHVPPLIDRLAPEHLELAVENPEEIADEVQHAGAIFLGRFTPEAVGDYVAGPNHVLPTSRNARFSSGLGVLDFMKRTSVVGGGEAALLEIGPTARLLAEAEGLEAHALSVALRLARIDGQKN